jgi:hypothetical protein
MLSYPTLDTDFFRLESSSSQRHSEILFGLSALYQLRFSQHRIFSIWMFTGWCRLWTADLNKERFVAKINNK